MSATWLLNLTFRAEKLGMCMASVSNPLLLFMLVFKASSSFGAYKHLMICYTVIEMTYSFISITTGMAAHSTESAYIVFQLYPGRFDRSIQPLFLIDFCGIYFVLLLILVVHFIYRYLVVCHFKKTVWFEGYNLIAWIVVPVIFGFSNALLKFFIFGENKYVTDKLRDVFMEHYGLTMEAIVYNGPNYYICDDFGQCEKPLLVWVTMIWICIALMNCVLLMSYCGYCTFLKLNMKDPHASIRTVELQKQLMVALVIQSVIPIVCMYIPILLLFISPMFGIAFGPYGNWVMGTLAIYPPIDQFAILYIIKDFRMAIKNFFSPRKQTPSAQSSVVVVSRLSV